MPYIESGIRASIEDGRKPIKPGELNYAISQLLRSYISMRGLSYTTINDIVGVLNCLNMEFYARIARPYEDLKIREHGDVF